MRTFFNILGISLIILASCQTEKKELIKPDKVLQIFENRLEGFFDGTKDSLSIYNCFLYDTANNNLMASGKYIIYDDDFPLPFGWFEYWNIEGNLVEKVHYTADSKSRIFEINQNIKFGHDTIDTIFEESSFINHNIDYLNEDTLEIKLKYRGWRENESNYAFLALTDLHDEFVFRTSKPRITFKLPIRKFSDDSNITILMIKTSDCDTNQDMLNLENIYYNIDLKK